VGTSDGIRDRSDLGLGGGEAAGGRAGVIGQRSSGRAEVQLLAGVEVEHLMAAGGGEAPPRSRCMWVRKRMREEGSCRS
jgi:hypothetical protein